MVACGLGTTGQQNVPVCFWGLFLFGSFFVVSQKMNYVSMLSASRRMLVREIMLNVQENGFVNGQHLYITFSTKHPKIIMPDYLKEDFPDAMTIVLQYEFWDLKVDDYGFSVSLSFSRGSENLYIPFSSIMELHDPMDQFTLSLRPDFLDLPKNDDVIVNNVIKNNPQSQNTSSSISNNKNNVISIDLFRKKGE